MTGSRLASLFRLPIWLLVGQVSCGSIAAWWNGRGPSFIMQDDETGGLRYSLCNGNYTPIFPDDRTLTALFKNYPPKNKTSLSAAGWVNDDTAWASIFFLTEDDEIVNSLLECDWGTGRWQSAGQWIISEGSPKVAPDTGLSTVLLGAEDGYRVFYNDLAGTLHHIGYTPKAATWRYYGAVSHDRADGPAIAATFSPKNNITVVRPRDEKNMGVSRLSREGQWNIATFPQPLVQPGQQLTTNATTASNLRLNTSSAAPFILPSWNATLASAGAGSLAIAVDAQYTRSIFYIGADRRPHRVGNQNFTWRSFDPPADSAAWPAADQPASQLAVASDFASSALRLYYVSGGRVIEAIGDGGVWRAAAAVPAVNESSIATETPSSTAVPTSGDAPNGGGGGLSEGAKAGISVGVTLGVIALGGMIAVLWFLRRRQRKRDAEAAAAAAAAATKGGAGGEAGGAEYQQPQPYMSPMSGYVVPTPGSGNNSMRGGYAPIPSPAQAVFAAAVGGARPGSEKGHQSQPSPGSVSAGGMTFSQQDGGWVYNSPAPAPTQFPNHGQPYAGSPQYEYHQPQEYYQPTQQHPQPQEMPMPQRPAEMMGEGHYKEVP
ncbi:hypothetical protein GGS23DRAFT_178682 [Durotheca rogersii]|uniref:uncharacterized protein n=1 Tax=Durotheca rogersii TaxID=419775 RepID=UPI0022209D16|nr:uncharacterized protein GGS23DRAFT_178682 [Durotheca rogersii]KAI5867454.1 hypothetical protein GGS23DRAFT_178682 [Durotheca rogersii]